MNVYDWPHMCLLGFGCLIGFAFSVIIDTCDNLRKFLEIRRKDKCK